MIAFRFHSPRTAWRASLTVALLLALPGSGRWVPPAAASSTNGAESVAASPAATNPPPAEIEETNAVERASRGRGRRSSRSGEPETANAPATNDYAAFKLIRDRNIFNSNRSKRSARDRGTETRPPRVETLSLVGTMSHARGAVAFFDGSESSYRKAIRPEGTIAGYKLVSVDASSVKLEKDGQTVELSMGGLMKRREDSPWEVIAPVRTAGGEKVETAEEKEILARLLKKREEEGEGGSGATPAAERASQPAETAKPPAASAPATTEGDAGNEVLKRLQQKRDEEQNK